MIVADSRDKVFAQRVVMMEGEEPVVASSEEVKFELRMLEDPRQILFEAGVFRGNPKL